MKKYKKFDNKYIEWLENNMNNYNLFYFEESSTDANAINCYFKSDKTHFCIFLKDVIDTIISQENNPN